MVKEMISCSGNPSAAWKQLHERFQPRDSALLDSIESEMHNARLGPDEEPISLLTKFEIYGPKLRKLGETRSERSILHQFLNSLPDE